MEPVDQEYVRRMNEEDAEQAAINRLFQDLKELGVRQANVDLIRRACNKDARIRAYLADLRRTIGPSLSRRSPSGGGMMSDVIESKVHKQTEHKGAVMGQEPRYCYICEREMTIPETNYLTIQTNSPTSIPFGWVHYSCLGVAKEEIRKVWSRMPQPSEDAPPCRACNEGVPNG